MNTTVKFTFPNGKTQEFTVDNEIQEQLDAGGHLAVIIIDPIDCGCFKCSFNDLDEEMTH